MTPDLPQTRLFVRTSPDADPWRGVTVGSRWLNLRSGRVSTVTALGWYRRRSPGEPRVPRVVYGSSVGSVNSSWTGHFLEHFEPAGDL